MSAKDFLEKLTVKEKIRLFNGQGNWKTFDANKKLPSFCMADGPHGLRKQEEEFYRDMNNSHVATCFPTASALASSWDKTIIQKLATSLALEAHYEKVDVLLGCGMNIKRSPLCGRNFEYFSEDPYLTAVLAHVYVKTLQENKIAACPKHFCCNNQEKKRQTSNSVVDERTLNEIYLRAFEYVVKKSQPKAIMASYNKVNSVYMSQNKDILTDILRKKWDFRGIVISDWGGCIEPSASLKAGMDLAMPDSHGFFQKQMQDAVDKNVLSENEIDIANERVINLAIELNENAKNNNVTQVDYDAQHKIATELATSSAVLLKNNGILPIKPTNDDGTRKKICVIGELAEFMRYQGGGSSHINVGHRKVSALDSLTKKGYNVVYSKGYLSGFVKQKKVAALNKPLQDAAFEVAKTAASQNVPILFFAGLTESFEGEGFDRKDLFLPPEQSALLEHILEITQNVVLVSFSGSPIFFQHSEKVAAILHMYLSGQGVADAIAILVSGEKSPSGHLAETFPLSEKDTPCYKNFAQNNEDIVYEEGVLVGYRYYETKNIPVFYEFGFGLTYTTFEYANLSVDLSQNKCTVSFTIKNTGNFDASEVAQIYVQNPVTQNIVRAKKELRGFTKIFLEKGQTKTVSVVLDDYAFCVYGTKISDFVQVEGDYVIQVASSVKDIRLEQEIRVEGQKIADVVGSATVEGFCVGKRRNFVTTDCLGDMAKKSLFAKILIGIVSIGLRITNKGKSLDDPTVKIQICTVRECALESLISTVGSGINRNFVNFIVWMANHHL